MNFLTICNNCDAAEMVEGDPRGYCADCIAETDGTATEGFNLVKIELGLDPINRTPHAMMWFATEDDARRFIAAAPFERRRRAMLDYFTVDGEAHVCVVVVP